MLGNISLKVFFVGSKSGNEMKQVCDGGKQSRASKDEKV